MTGFFPKLHPDETLHSACSRYHARAGYRTREATGRDLLGAERLKVAIDLPSNIGTLVSSLPPGHRYTVDYFIGRHTLLPFYAPFLPPERVIALLADMRGSGGASIHGRLGTLVTDIGSQYLRFCPECVRDDREKCDDGAYWHRVHQVPGVEVCHIHGIFLQESSVHSRNRSHHDAFVTAEQVVSVQATHVLDPSNKDHQVLLRIAVDAAWLLGKEGLSVESENSHRERYVELLFHEGLSTYPGTVSTGLLIQRLKEFYTPALLMRLECLIEAKYNWVHRLVHNTRGAQHPLQHLLLMQFLGITAEEFFRLPSKRQPFGKGPWPCLNPVSDHFGEELITRYEVASLTQRNGRRPRAIFHCDCCGYAYYRVGPDGSDEDRRKSHGVITFGDVWDEKLKQAFTKSEDGKQLLDRFGVKQHTLDKQLIRLGLVSIREDGGCAKVDRRFRRALSPKQEEEIGERHRKDWSEVLRANPELGRSALREKAPDHYIWLYQHDRKWLKANLPDREHPSGPKERIDWPARDTKIALAVKLEAEKLRCMPGRPVWISETALARRIGKLGVISKHGDKLPLTLKALEEMSETIEEYAVRRVQWAAACLHAEGIRPSRWQLQIRATISHRVATRPQVEQAMIDALHTLNTEALHKFDHLLRWRKHIMEPNEEAN
jgi:hypothetical protein